MKKPAKRKRPVTSMYFTHVAPASPERIVLAGHLHACEDQRVTRIAAHQGKAWEHLGDLSEIVACLTAVPEDGAVSCYALLRNGVLHRWRGAEHSVEVIDKKRGLFFSEVRRIGAHLCACGMGFQVFRREPQGWVPIDDGLYVGRETAEAILAEREALRGIIMGSLLWSIDGRSEDDIYAVGAGGVIFHFDGRRWKRLESPIDCGLNVVRCFADATYICGAHGHLLRGGTEGWEVLAGKRGQPDLTDIEMHGDRIYVASEFQLSVLGEKGLSPVRVPLKGEPGFGSLASSGNRLWSVGGETILAYEGGTWTPHPCPWNEREPTS